MRLAECEILTDVVCGRFRIYPIGDMHSDTMNFAEDRFKAYIAHIARDKQAIALSVGDYCEGRVPGKKHFDPASLIPEARLHIGDYIAWNLDRAHRLLAPLMGKVPMFLWQGNHDHYMEYSGFTAMLSDRLKATFMGDEGFVTVRAGRKFRKDKSHESDLVDIYGTHGSGGAGLPGAKVNAMQRYPSWVDADVVIAGHVHDSMVRIFPRIGVTKGGSGAPRRLVSREICLIRAPSFVRRAVEGVDTYAGRKSYPTSDEGLQYVEAISVGGSKDPPVRRRYQRHEFLGPS